MAPAERAAGRRRRHGGQTAAFSEQAGHGAPAERAAGRRRARRADRRVQRAGGSPGGSQQNEQQVGGGGHGQTGAFSEQAGPVLQQNEQQVAAGTAGRPARSVSRPAALGAPSRTSSRSAAGTAGRPARSVSRPASAATQQNEQQVGGEPATARPTRSTSSRTGSAESIVSRRRLAAFHGDDVPAGVRYPQRSVRRNAQSESGESTHASTDGESHYGTPVHEEPTHVSSEEHSFEDAGHAAATEDARRRSRRRRCRSGNAPRLTWPELAR